MFLKFRSGLHWVEGISVAPSKLTYYAGGEEEKAILIIVTAKLHKMWEKQ